MLLNKQQILDIINKEPRKLRDRLNGQVINEYSYTLDEQLNLIQTYIYSVKGVDVGNIKPSKGELCPSFVHLAVINGINPVFAMNKGSDLEAANFAMNVALKYFKNDS